MNSSPNRCRLIELTESETGKVCKWRDVEQLQAQLKERDELIKELLDEYLENAGYLHTGIVNKAKQLLKE